MKPVETLADSLLPINKFPATFSQAVFLIAWLAMAPTVLAQIPNDLQQLVKRECLDCHTGTEPEADFDIEKLLESPVAQHLDQWTTLHDRVQAGEMPPDGLPESTRVSWSNKLFQILVSEDRQLVAQQGRAVLRRMNRFEYENSLRQLLHAPWLQLKSILPEDGELYRFNKIGQALDVSHVNMARYMQAAEHALRAVMAKHITAPEIETHRYYARTQNAFNRKVHFSVFNRSPSRATFPLLGHAPDLEVLNDPERPFTVGADDPERREQEAFGVVASSYEPIEIYFSEFRAPEAGKYRLRLKGYTFWANGEDKRWWRPRRDKIEIGRRPEPVLIYSQIPPRQLRRLGAIDFDVQPSVQEIEAWLLEGESIQPDAVRLFRSRPPGGWHNPLAEKDGVPGVAFNYLEVEGPLFEQWPPPGHQLLFGDLPLVQREDHVDVQSLKPREDARRLLRQFVDRAYRRPVTDEEFKTFLKVIFAAFEQGLPFSDAMLAGYTTVLCSPGFLCLEESSQALSGKQLAARLSLFLNNSLPDDQLLQSASDLPNNSELLLKETNRLLDSPKVHSFVDTFLDYWLDLRKINATSPDEMLYPDYYLDDALVDAALQETQLFFKELIQENLPVGNIVDSDFTFANERLAKHYELPSQPGVTLKKVMLPADSPRGGLMTQASILKVTANGTTTSPVVRGAWIGERILGIDIPPPPKSVPAIEPDTRGASTIREQLELHRADESCNSCHRKIDPAGFALESFDVAGGYREFYRSLGDEGELQLGYGKNGQPFNFRAGPKVDSSGYLPDGREFSDVRELKALLLSNEREIAKNLLKQLLLYATGAPPRISDRPEIDAILDRLEADHYPIRSMIHEIVDSPMFRSK